MAIKFIIFIILFILAFSISPCLAGGSVKNSMLQMTSTLENSDTQLQWNYAENINDGRGITFGCIGFCTGTYDGNVLVKYYTTLNPNNPLAKYIPALNAIDAGPHNAAGGDGNPSVAGLDGFTDDVHDCNDSLFKQAQLYELDQLYYNPAVSIANSIGAENALTLAFIYDMCIRHGSDDAESIVNSATSALGGTPKTGIDENTYLSKLISLRDDQLNRENFGDINRDVGFKNVLASGNVNLTTPFTFVAYGSSFIITGDLGFDSQPFQLVAEFTASPLYGNVPLEVMFTDFSTGYPTKWLWDFGDGNTSTQQNTTHTYAAAGDYTVNLTVSNANGTASKFGTINALEETIPPVIQSVVLFPANTITGSKINVTVNATDNVGVRNVIANKIPLLNQGGNLWNGSITALEGTHSVNVSAMDEAGNIAWNNSTAYTALTPENLPPSSVTNLQSTSGPTWLNWTWTNPSDPDFNHTEIYLNGTFQNNTSAEYFNATDLQPETSYTLSTRTVDNSGNVNETWVNSTATASNESVPIIPVFPGYTNPPTDLDHDGLYEDINGNGIIDFDDVVALYDNMEWVPGSSITFFDYNNNSGIDFDDVIKLYDRL